MAAANIGMMDGAYFVGRNEILAWINTTLQLSLSKIEEASGGAIYVQLVDSTHPGVVPLHKVNFDAKNEYEMMQNYKVLQDVFNKLKINKHIDVMKLIKGRTLDNLEFVQWLKRYCDSVNGGIASPNYNPVERREACKGGKEANKKLSHMNSSGPAMTKSAAKVTSSIALSTPRPGESTANPLRPKQPAAPPTIIPPVVLAPQTPAKVFALQEQITELKLSVDNLEKERDFYFSKLRDIEILCQTPEIESVPVVRAIQKILYAIEDNPTVIAEAQALVTTTEKENASPNVELPTGRRESLKRKSIGSAEAEAALSPRQRRSSYGEELVTQAASDPLSVQ